MFRDSRNEWFESHFQFNTGTGLAILRRTKIKSVDSSLNIVFGPTFALLLSSPSIKKTFSYWIASYDAVKKRFQRWENLKSHISAGLWRSRKKINYNILILFRTRRPATTGTFFGLHFLDYFNHCAYTRIRMQYASITNAQKYQLIQTRTEPLRSKQVFTEQLILKGVIFILIYLIIYLFRYKI